MPTTPDSAHPNEDQGTTSTDDEHEEHVRRRKDELLDQGVEETFPASDPVAVKHIT